jgi:adenosyl cobinamide kinase/adenosyl cobinamide phosphate guanylyltransferase
MYIVRTYWEMRYKKTHFSENLYGDTKMANVMIEIDDDLAKYLQRHADTRNVLLADVLGEMIYENLTMAHDIDDALQIADIDTTDCDRPVVEAVSVLKSALRYHKETERLLQADSLTLWTLRKIDARKGDNRTRDGFLGDLMDHMEEKTKRNTS